MKLVFFGSSKFSTIVEEALYKKFGLSLVVTLPDRETGRKKVLTPNPVKSFAIEHNVPVVEADKLDKKVVERIKDFSENSDAAQKYGKPENRTDKNPGKLKSDLSDNLKIRSADSPSFPSVPENNRPDFLVVADYGLFLPNKLLTLPKFSPLNVHHSFLPKYRGPSPAPTAILNGEKISGLSIIKMNEQLDAGDILVQKEYELKPNETTESLLTELNKLGAELITDVIENYEEFSTKAKKQDESKTTFTKKITKQDGYIDLSNLPDKEQVDRMIRAYFPWPNVWSKIRIKNRELRIKFLPMQKIQAEGGKPMNVKDFLNGYPMAKEMIEKIL